MQHTVKVLSVFYRNSTINQNHLLQPTIHFLHQNLSSTSQELFVNCRPNQEHACTMHIVLEIECSCSQYSVLFHGTNKLHTSENMRTLFGTLLSCCGDPGTHAPLEVVRTASANADSTKKKDTDPSKKLTSVSLN